MVAGPPSPSLAEISRNTSVISSSSSSSSTSSLITDSDKTQKPSLPVPVRPTRTFAAPSHASAVDRSQSQASFLPGYIQRELGISSTISSAPSSLPSHDVGTHPSMSGPQKQQPRARFNSPQDFEFGDILGHGSYSTVIQAKGKKSGRTYAIKVLDKAHLQRHNQRRTAYAEKEALVALGLSHTGIVGLHSTFSDAWSLYFVLDFLPNGDLRALISRYGSLSLECTRYYIAQLADTLAYIHSKNVMHRDIKPENLLLDSRFRLALADFGTAKVLPPSPPVSTTPPTQNNYSQTETSTPAEQVGPSWSNIPPIRRSNTFVGTPQYYSPELLTHSYTTPASDLWALGCVLYELYTGTFAFNASSPLLTWRLIKELKYVFPDDFDEDAKDLVQRLLVTNPEERLGASGENENNGMRDLKSHKFFKDVEWNRVWEIPHPKLVTGLKTLSEPATVPDSDAELGAQLRDERLRDEDGDEIAWSKDARLAAYLPGLRHSGTSAVNYENGVPDGAPPTDGQRIPEGVSFEKYSFPMLRTDVEDGGLPYSLQSSTPVYTGMGERGADLEKGEGLEREESKSEGATNLDIVERNLNIHLGEGTCTLVQVEDVSAHVRRSKTPPASIIGAPLEFSSNTSPIPADFASILQPSETILLSSPLISDASTPNLARLLPKLLPGSTKRKPKELVLLLTTCQRLLCVANSGKGALVVRHEFAVGNTRVMSGDSSIKSVIEGVDMRGDRLVLLTNGEPVVYTLADLTALAKLGQLIQEMLQTTESAS